MPIISTYTVSFYVSYVSTFCYSYSSASFETNFAAIFSAVKPTYKTTNFSAVYSASKFTIRSAFASTIRPTNTATIKTAFLEPVTATIFITNPSFDSA